MASRPKASAPENPPDEPAREGLGSGVEHLQAAAHEMLAAARSFLDVVEDVVSDKDKLGEVAATVTELLGTAGSSLGRVADRVAGQAGAAAKSATSSGGTGAPTKRVRRIDVD
ncbi:MAG: hypothetical protein U0Q22_17840 [Acidimicrobiales bacterium]